MSFYCNKTSFSTSDSNYLASRGFFDSSGNLNIVDFVDPVCRHSSSSFSANYYKGLAATYFYAEPDITSKFSKSCATIITLPYYIADKPIQIPAPGIPFFENKVHYGDNAGTYSYNFPLSKSNPEYVYIFITGGSQWFHL